jgi:hypothetical protein
MSPDSLPAAVCSSPPACAPASCGAVADADAVLVNQSAPTFRMSSTVDAASSPPWRENHALLDAL